MPKFTVLLEKPLGTYGPGGRRIINPFVHIDIFNPQLTVRFDVREFIFDADSESHVEQLLAEAREQDIPNVRGYRLRSITQESNVKNGV